MKKFSKLKNKRVLLVGGAGFIGHNMALELSRYGAETFVIDSLQVNSFGAILDSFQSNTNAKQYLSYLNERIELLSDHNINFNLVDARDYHKVAQAITATNPDVVIHLAAVSHANRSNKDPFSTFDHSMRTIENVLDAIRDTKTHLIFFSSSMVYGHFGNEPATEDRPCEPLGIYGALKFGAEKLVQAYHQVFGTNYTIIRPSALYGERCVSRRVGQAFIENALSGKNLTINGDGEDALDFTYIQDLIQGVCLAICNENALNEVFNITFGEGRKINDLAKIVLKHFPGTSIIYNPRDQLMPERGTLSIDKAKTLIGYEPAFPIEIGIERYINWYFKNKTH
jgi:nucleoside-diphosphate-sugar epimerase